MEGHRVSFVVLEGYCYKEPISRNVGSHADLALLVYRSINLYMA